MAEPLDTFADNIRISVSSFGCALHFGVTQPHMTSEETAGPAQRVATIRLTPEFLKGIAFLLRENVLSYERGMETKIAIPPDMMQQALVGSSIERWNRCWEE